MFKAIIRTVGMAMTFYIVVNRAYRMGGKERDHEWYNKLKEAAEKHPEMTLAELMFKEVEEA